MDDEKEEIFDLIDSLWNDFDLLKISCSIFRKFDDRIVWFSIHCWEFLIWSWIGTLILLTDCSEWLNKSGLEISIYKDRQRKNLNDEKTLQKFKEAINISTTYFHLMSYVQFNLFYSLKLSDFFMPEKSKLFSDFEVLIFFHSCFWTSFAINSSKVKILMSIQQKQQVIDDYMIQQCNIESKIQSNHDFTFYTAVLKFWTSS